MNASYRLSVLGLMLLGACAETPGQGTGPAPSGPATPPASLANPPADRHGPPIVLHVSRAGSRNEDRTFELSVLLERDGRGADPIELEVSLPAGVRLVRGQLREHIVETGRTVRRTLVLHAEVPPRDDVVVTATSSGVSHGARATAAFRFGRPEPKLPPSPNPPIGLGGGKPRDSMK